MLWENKKKFPPKRAVSQMPVLGYHLQRCTPVMRIRMPAAVTIVEHYIGESCTLLQSKGGFLLLKQSFRILTF